MGSEGPVWTAVPPESRISSACGRCGDSCVLVSVPLHLRQASGGQFCFQPKKGDLGIHIVSLSRQTYCTPSSSITDFGKGSRPVLQPGLPHLSSGRPPCHPAEELEMQACTPPLLSPSDLHSFTVNSRPSTSAGSPGGAAEPLFGLRVVATENPSCMLTLDTQGRSFQWCCHL